MDSEKADRPPQSKTPPRLVVLKAEFATEMHKWTPKALPDLPQFCFAGRSNVGKSSLLNCLVERKNLARTSSTPGRTQAIIVFHVALRLDGVVREMHFADLPGYGYAKAPKSVRDQWQPMIEGYLARNKRLRAAMMLLDVRHDPTELDLAVAGMLEAAEVATFPVATKIDKISRGQRFPRFRALADAVGTEPDDIWPFSASTKEGRGELLAAIFEMAGEAAAPDE